MLSQPQARFVEAYFSDVGHYARSDADEVKRTLREPAVRTVLAAIWGQILEHVAVQGHRIHHLPKQGEKQSGMGMEVR
jgi:hypothetical protein